MPYSGRPVYPRHAPQKKRHTPKTTARTTSSRNTTPARQFPQGKCPDTAFHSRSPSRISPSRSLCFALRAYARGFSAINRSAFGWPSRSRALDFTALVTENFFAAFFLATSPSVHAHDAIILSRCCFLTGNHP